MLGRTPLRRLKESTATRHADAEQHVRILAPAASVADYGDYLHAFHAFHAAVEPALRPLDGVGFESAARGRAALAREDLAALGIAPVLACTWRPARHDLASLLGVAYVLEGSTLGGRFILAKLPPAIAALRGRATRFLDGYGTATGARWRAFGALVERELATDLASELACGAACETFDGLIAWLVQVNAGARRRAS